MWLFTLRGSVSCFAGAKCINEWCSLWHSLHLCSEGQFLRKWHGLKQFIHNAFFLMMAMFRSSDMAQKSLDLCHWCFALQAAELSRMSITYDLTWSLITSITLWPPSCEIFSEARACIDEFQQFCARWHFFLVFAVILPFKHRKSIQLQLNKWWVKCFQWVALRSRECSHMFLYHVM